MNSGTHSAYKILIKMYKKNIVVLDTIYCTVLYTVFKMSN